MIKEKNIHSPFVEELENSNTMVIFIHGILESPNQFNNLSRIAIDNNVSVCAILLDGHGRTGEDFANSSWNKVKHTINHTKTGTKNRNDA